jgi:mono/diheme cytochrome c family protein
MRPIKVIFLVAVVALCASVGLAQKAGLATDTQHGAVGTTPCGSCHTPHTGTNGAALLWVRSVGTTTYTTYTSPTMGNATANITAPGDGNITPGLPSNNTLLCMSCHDGALAATNTVTLRTTTYGAVGGTITGSAVDIGGTSTLTNDHPVNMSYNPTNDAGLDTVANVTGAGLVLYSGGATTNTVQCGSCHDPHKQGPQGGPGVGKYLRVSNAASGLCLTCHL